MHRQRPFYIRAGSVLTETEVLQNHCVLIDDGSVVDISSQPRPGIEVADYSELNLLPGLIDLHIHGREGCDVMDGSLSSIRTISRSLAKYGVTGFLATTVTADWEKTLRAYEIIGQASELCMPGAEVLGAYNEGLFFAEAHKGAHNEAFFLDLTRERIDKIYAASKGTLKVMALAPELGDSMEQIRYLASLGVQVMLGHTNANFDCASRALEEGAAGGVHIFNGMSGIHHRDPGCAGAVLLNQRALAEVIADGIHVHPSILQLIYRLKGASGIALISDCISAGGFPDGVYQLGELSVEVKNGVARTQSGSLAGSTLTLNQGVLNMNRLGQVPLLDAVNMASIVPARHIGIDDKTGSVACGKKANLTLVNDQLGVKATLVNGRFVYNADESEKASHY
ncbi:N-acetylglucosamine-6-phosphate deacetylase [Lacimicrobium alkaliphilum]|uniref:N-acetylgalactosamine-6-phosphate deacetylase n=1 Tax=Lacimicrobium alkaliphilum TaxID=1526571 RepID=A0ABQ1RJ54_9ALTE|nr:N-acetylglucosamine-6-phosphate deacetylase [Lacimicrobium alkaliphilum]GGD69690.1 N-acetylglucosamine-6-phosphate deacetylase [Lacimicrobium alkaliphilum]